MRHEAELVEAAIEEKATEAGEGGIAQVAAAIEIIGALLVLVGGLQVLVVCSSRAGEATGQCPEAFGIQAAAGHR